jgi:MFS transporter, FHS family, glucose/mannose:H+ symporter
LEAQELDECVSPVVAPVDVRGHLTRHQILNFAALVTAFVVFAPLINSVGVIVLQSIRTLGISKQQAGVVQPFVDMPMALSSLVIGSVLPMLGLRKAMLGTLFASAMACLAMPLLPRFWLFKTHLVVIGVCFAATKVALYTSIGTLADSKKKHAALMSTVEGLFMFGILSGYWVFGWFSRFDLNGRPGWLNAYWLFASLLVVAALILWRNPIRDQGATLERGVMQWDLVRAELLFLMRFALTPIIVSYAVTDMLYVLLEQAVGAWLPTFNAEVLRLSPSLSIQLASEFSLGLGVGGLIGGAVLRRVGWFLVLTACLSGVAMIVLLGLPIARNMSLASATSLGDLPPAAFLFPAIGACLGPINPAINSAVLSCLPRRHHPAMAGLIIVFSSIGGSTGAVVTGVLFQARGSDAFYFILAPVIVLWIVLLMFNRAIQRYGLTTTTLA